MKNKFKNSENRDKQWLSVESERFMIFMRPTSLTDFRKPWGKITLFKEFEPPLDLKNQFYQKGIICKKVNNFLL